LEEDILLDVRGISKRFIAIRALEGVDFSLRRGEIHALVGENGAGKSTFVNIIAGVLSPDDGDIYIEGKYVKINNRREAQKLGVGFVSQEINLCPDVTVAENIFMSAINQSKKIIVNYKNLYKESEKILKLITRIDPKKKVSELKVSEQQVVEIAKEVFPVKCKFLLLDEPTSSLSESEADSLFKIIQRLKKQGKGIVYITHRINEVFSQCDRVTVFRDGRNMGTYEVTKTDRETICNKMVGRKIGNMYPPKKNLYNKVNEVLFEVRNFSDDNIFRDINFKLYNGEILGLAGFVGAGRTEVLQTICGIRSKTKGEVFYKCKKLNINTFADAIKNGIIYFPEDRKNNGLFLNMMVKQNIFAMYTKVVSKKGFINKKLEEKLTKKYIENLNIKCSNINQNVISLSGGNQQKVLFAKSLVVKPKILFMDEPTRGIDVGAKAEMHKLLRQLSNEGVGVIMISSELPELIGMCDRIIVINEGVQCGELIQDKINEKCIIHMASGI